MQIDTFTTLRTLSSSWTNHVRLEFIQLYRSWTTRVQFSSPITVNPVMLADKSVKNSHYGSAGDFLMQSLSKEQVTLKRTLAAVCKSNKSSKILLFCQSCCYSVVSNKDQCQIVFALPFFQHFSSAISESKHTKLPTQRLPELVEKDYAGTIQSKPIASLSFHRLLSLRQTVHQILGNSTKCLLKHSPYFGWTRLDE